MRNFVFVLFLTITGGVWAIGGAGLYGGWPEVFGIQFVTPEGWRLSVGLAPERADPERYSVAVSLDLVLAAGTLYSDGGEMVDLAYYAGAGATASVLRAEPEVNGHAMLGLEAYFTAMKSVGFFGELQLGQRFVFMPLWTQPYLGLRVGLSLR
ncbi:MAG TPA: hypothetical protein ENK37_00255 [Oceanithermus profundus]|uniref:Uncharacterized protein n=1 Tax=Oceanithermus profundus TaxID=187137 RepID=A0A7C4ZEV0_9DEIN|nr:hypothetical protein [Oceanithermus profundus]